MRREREEEEEEEEEERKWDDGDKESSKRVRDIGMSIRYDLY